MTFNSGAQLDPDQVTDVRGRSYGGGRGLAVGGGGIGLVIAVVYLLLGGNPADLAPAGGGAANGPIGSQATQECKTGDQANARTDCRIVGFVDSIQAYWKDEFTQRGPDLSAGPDGHLLGRRRHRLRPGDDRGRAVLLPAGRDRLHRPWLLRRAPIPVRRQGRPLAEGYVVAHEYGHHVQDLEGLLSGDSGGTGADSRSVRTELMADCFAGIWVNHAASTGFLKPPTKEQVGDALDAAAAVGDDRIQQKTQGRVNPESWTHGSAEQRQHWFTVGLQTGKPDSCDTFDNPI